MRFSFEITSIHSYSHVNIKKYRYILYRYAASHASEAKDNARDDLKEAAQNEHLPVHAVLVTVQIKIAEDFKTRMKNPIRTPILKYGIFR
jgi:hypothetical protein